MTTSLINPIPATLWDLGSFKSNLNPTPIVLHSTVTNGAGESRYSHLRKSGTTVAYQVTAGKTLWLTRVVFRNGTRTWLTLYGTADAGLNQVAAPAGAVALDSIADGSINAFTSQTGTDVRSIEFATILTCPPLSFPCVRCMDATNTLWVTYFGHEE